MGIGIAFRKAALESAGGFNQNLQVFEYLELSLRAKGFKGVKTPDLTVLHLEPESRFSFVGFLKRRVEYGFWYHSLFYLYPKRLSFYAFPIKLFVFLAFISLSIIFGSALLLLPLVPIYVAWLILHYGLLSKENPIRFTASKFARSQRVLVYLLSIIIESLGELAGDLGKMEGIIKSPTRK